jgi:hypothetical protein
MGDGLFIGFVALEDSKYWRQYAEFMTRELPDAVGNCLFFS